MRKSVGAPGKDINSSFSLRALVVWIWLCAGLNVAGWALSAIGQLNAAGYIAVLVIGVIGFCAWRHFDRSERPSRAPIRKWLHRFKRPLPLAFLILSAMILAGGAIYAPTNYDGLSYRLPRVLHWLAAGKWHWIHTDFPRLNNRACGIEWVSTPLVALLKTDRFLFLINFVSFLFLPGLTFGVLSRLGVRRRVAWHWMWLAPTGYCFLLQAGSIANDSFAAPFALAAIFFALRARDSGRMRDVACSILSAALLTATKTGNMTLLLPWAIAILPALRIMLRRPIATAAVCFLGIFSSFAPTAVLNSRFCGDWSGLSMESDQAHGSMPLRLGANLALISVLNVVPPVFPEADQWNRFEQRVVPPGLNTRLHESFTEPEAAELHVEQMQIEENAGFGFGPTLFVALSALVAAVSCRKSFFQFRFDSFDGLCEAGIVITSWVAALALLSQSTVYPIGRIMAPYYILLLPLLLRSPYHEKLVRKYWWRAGALFVFALAAGLLIISPARPLFPVGTVLAKIQSSHPNSKLLARIEEVYSVYHNRNHAFAPVLGALPADSKVLGIISYDDPETSLWQPFGSRRIVCVKPSDNWDYLNSQGVQIVLARMSLFGARFPDYADWSAKMNATIIDKFKLNIRADNSHADWYLIEIHKSPGSVSTL
ncbi:MAG TPA: hypothetical protein VMF08_01540 [Candidatus Sulfotelmatobacter sp.]|nr:hypothetical protein [Candidatus Sulfotelmatobacter sp.]